MTATDLLRRPGPTVRRPVVAAVRAGAGALAVTGLVSLTTHLVAGWAGAEFAARGADS